MPVWPARGACAQAWITVSKPWSIRISQSGAARKRSSVLRSERCSLKRSTSSTMRGSGLHQRMGWPSLNHGKMPLR